MAEFLDGIWREQGGGRYLNRYDAGRGIVAKFRAKIEALAGKGVVVGLLRGGVEVAAAVANDLRLPLDFRSVRKVGHPFQPEFAIGAVDISGISVRNPLVSPMDMPSDEDFDRMVASALEQARDLETEIRGDRPSPVPDADWVLVVDDGAATGLTILAVTKGLQSEGKKVYVAVPVASEQAVALISKLADGFFANRIPPHFMAVGQFYDDFSPLSVEEVKSYLGYSR
jgi:putative phosphoribosyl transferase